MSEDRLPPSRTADQFVVRFPDGMRDQIAEAAKANNRSMNAEIIARLQRTFELESGGPHIVGFTPEQGRNFLRSMLEMISAYEKQIAERNANELAKSGKPKKGQK